MSCKVFQCIRMYSFCDKQFNLKFEVEYSVVTVQTGYCKEVIKFHVKQMVR